MLQEACNRGVIEDDGERHGASFVLNALKLDLPNRLPAYHYPSIVHCDRFTILSLFSFSYFSPGSIGTRHSLCSPFRNISSNSAYYRVKVTSLEDPVIISSTFHLLNCVFLGSNWSLLHVFLLFRIPIKLYNSTPN